MKHADRLAAIALCLTAAACGDTAGPTGPDEVTVSGSAVYAADAGGSWTFQRELVLTAPEWVAALVFGIQPEGSVTHIECADAGTLHLVQTGAALSGSATITGGTCTTRGGQAFTMPQPGIVIPEGTVAGTSVRFVWVEDGYLPCTYHLVLSGTSLDGTGRCVVPGHPQSPVPADPPPAGTSKVVSFSATRS
ncbi:MAG TPA: hypothetical protein VFZ69_12485 [Longimicrobiales bacterium]